MSNLKDACWNGSAPSTPFIVRYEACSAKSLLRIRWICVKSLSAARLKRWVEKHRSLLLTALALLLCAQ